MLFYGPTVGVAFGPFLGVGATPGSGLYGAY